MQAEGVKSHCEYDVQCNVLGPGQLNVRLIIGRLDSTCLAEHLQCRSSVCGICALHGEYINTVDNAPMA